MAFVRQFPYISYIKQAGQQRVLPVGWTVTGYSQSTGEIVFAAFDASGDFLLSGAGEGYVDGSFRKEAGFVLPRIQFTYGGQFTATNSEITRWDVDSNYNALDSWPWHTRGDDIDVAIGPRRSVFENDFYPDVWFDDESFEAPTPDPPTPDPPPTDPPSDGETPTPPPVVPTVPLNIEVELRATLEDIPARTRIFGGGSLARIQDQVLKRWIVRWHPNVKRGMLIRDPKDDAEYIITNVTKRRGRNTFLEILCQRRDTIVDSRIPSAS